MAIATSTGLADEVLESRRPVGQRVLRRKSRRADPWSNRDKWPAIAMLTPNVALFTIFIIIPILLAIIISFTNWNLVAFPQFVGMANYRRLLSDPMVWQSIKTTLIFLVMGVIPTVVLGLLLAMLVNVKIRFIGVLRTLYFVPAVVSLVASAVLWQWIYRPGQGILDFLLYKVGIIGPAWLSNTTTALPALAIVAIWLSLPVAILLYLAALQRIPESILEAATLDGAGAFRRLRYVIWPGVRNMTLLVAIVAILAFTSGSFDLVNVLTQGGPINATTTLIYYIYYVAFSNIQLGYAAALSLVQLLMMVGLIGVFTAARRVVSRR